MKGFQVGDDRAVIAGRQGGQVRGKQLIAERERMWAERYPGIPVEAARQIYLEGYGAGHQAKRQQQRKVDRWRSTGNG